MGKGSERRKVDPLLSSNLDKKNKEKSKRRYIAGGRSLTFFLYALAAVRRGPTIVGRRRLEILRSLKWVLFPLGLRCWSITPVLLVVRPG